MEEYLKKILEEMHDIKNHVSEISQSIKTLELRMDKLEKLESIEHRVSVNQIDLQDIKEIVEKMESCQKDELNEYFQFLKGTTVKIFNEELHQINQRLDAQLTKIAKNEEAIMLIDGKGNKVS